MGLYSEGPLYMENGTMLRLAIGDKVTIGVILFVTDLLEMKMPERSTGLPGLTFCGLKVCMLCLLRPRNGLEVFQSIHGHLQTTRLPNAPKHMT